MSVTLRTLDALATLASLQDLIREREGFGFELITLAKGFVGNQPTNVATFHPRIAPLQQVTLDVVDNSLEMLQQQLALTERENEGKTLISYGVGFIEGGEVNIAIFRG